MNEIFIHRVDNIPIKIKGLVTETIDGDYIIWINDSLCDEAKKKTVEHELYHVLKGHFDSFDSLRTNESETEENCLITKKEWIYSYIRTAF